MVAKEKRRGSSGVYPPGAGALFGIRNSSLSGHGAPPLEVEIS
jgi:hypothetical protein